MMGSVARCGKYRLERGRRPGPTRQLLMKILLSASLSFIAGCVLWWFGIQLSGFLAALSWPDFLTTFSLGSRLQALYLWQVAADFLPVFCALTAAGYALFRLIRPGLVMLFAAVLPYILLNWITGSFDFFSYRSALSIYGLALISLSAFPLGIGAGWLLASRKARGAGGRTLKNHLSARPPPR